jgi:hypothetical protein
MQKIIEWAIIWRAYCETTSARSADGEGAAKRPPSRWLNSFVTHTCEIKFYIPTREWIWKSEKVDYRPQILPADFALSRDKTKQKVSPGSEMGNG